MIHKEDDGWVNQYNAGKPKLKVDFPQPSPMLTAKQLKDRYEADLKFLQSTCKHGKISEWLPYYWAPAHYSHDVRQCEICWTVVETRNQAILDHNDEQLPNE